MKTINQLSKEYKIPKSTLRSRFRKLNIPYDGLMLINLEAERQIIYESKRGIKNLQSKINPLLVFGFKEEHPFLNNFEVSQCLCVPVPIVDNILNSEYFTIPSKINGN